MLHIRGRELQSRRRTGRADAETFSPRSAAHRRPEFFKAMKSPKIFQRLAPLVAAALMLNFADAAAAQRSQPPTPQATPRPAATPQTQTQTQTQTTTQPRAAAPVQQQRRAEPDRAVEELLSADAYAVYVELRNIGALAQTQEVKTALGMPALLGEEVRPATEPLTDLLGLVTVNA